MCSPSPGAGRAGMPGARGPEGRHDPGVSTLTDHDAPLPNLRIGLRLGRQVDARHRRVVVEQVEPRVGLACRQAGSHHPHRRGSH